jgi:hypothetical protein
MLRKWFFFFGVINIVLGLILAVVMFSHLDVFGDLSHASTSTIEVLFICFAPVFVGIALMITGWPRKGG